jgi:YidC/Oxa1 family membrane protein insertase
MARGAGVGWPYGECAAATPGAVTASILSPRPAEKAQLTVFDLLATLLAWFYDLIPNYAIAIGLLTLTIMVAVTPLTLKGTKGMLELQMLQPEIRRLQQQHRGDRQKLNEEMMKLYQEHKVNPIGGCLPLLLQAPIFLILYRVLIGLTARANFFDQLVGGATGHPPDNFFRPSYLDHSTKLYQDLRHSDEMQAFGIDLSQRATDVISDSFVKGLPYLGLVLLVGVLSYIQQWQVTARNKDNSIVNPQQKMLMRVLPALFAVISLTLPSGIIFYFIVSNLYRIAQQAYITRRFYKGEHSMGARAAAVRKETSSEDGKAAKDPSPAKGGGAKSTKKSGPSPNGKQATAPKGRPTPSGKGRPTPKVGRPVPPAKRAATAKRGGTAPPARPRPQPKKKS